MNIERLSPASRYWIFASLLTIIRAVIILASPYNLYLEEPYYWSWAQTPAWGYFSKPPLTAWLIAATTAWSDGPLAVKAGSLLLYPLSGWLVFLITARCATPQTALRTALLFQLMPAVSFSALIISTDVPLVCCWAATIWLALYAVDKQNQRYWLAAGGAFGLGLLAKYNMLLLLPGLGLWLLATTSQWRQHWRGFVYMVLVAALITLPNIYWNLGHQFASYGHTMAISGVNQHQWQWSAIAEFLGAQIALLGPGCALAAGYLLLRWPRQIRPMLLLTLPATVVMIAVAGFGQANANWSAPVLVSLIVACGLWAGTNNKRWLLLIVPNLLITMLFYSIHGGGLFDRLFHDQPQSHPYKRTLGWSAVVSAVASATGQLNRPCIISPSRELLAWTQYLARDQVKPADLFSLPPADGSVSNQFDLLQPLKPNDAHTRCILVVEQERASLASQFSESHQVTAVDRQWQGHSYQHLLLFVVADWQGQGR